MENKPIVLTLVLLGIVLISGCIGQEAEITDEEKAISACKAECNSRLSAGEGLSAGPCLLDPIPESPDWVCDVAHEPRQDIDDQPENQCSAFRERRANHFVEVDPNCEFIKAW